MVPTDPTADLSLLMTLYHSGAFFCLGIIALYIGLRWASTHIAWLAGGDPAAKHRALYVSALLGGLALLAVPAMQGTTPNVQMIATAIGTVIALTMNPQKAIAGGAVLLVLLLVPPACGGASVSTRLNAGGSAFATCAQADLTAVVGSGSTAQKIGAVINRVEAILVAGLANWQAELDVLALEVGPAAWQCILDFAEAFLSPPPATTAGSGPGSGKVGAGAPPEALQRLRAYRAHMLTSKLGAQLDSTSAVVDQALAIVGAEQHR